MSTDTREHATKHRPHRHGSDHSHDAPHQTFKVKTKRSEVVTSNVNGQNPFRNGFDRPVLVWFGALHLGALAAPFFFSWQGLALFAVMSFFTGSVGICMGYHRLLTHGSFVTSRPLRYFFAFVGGLAGEGSCLQWVATHRKHHIYSDHEEDPHSPRHGGVWSHITWMMPQYGRKYHDELYQRYCPDLLKDRGMCLIHKLFLPSHLVLGAVFTAVGYAVGGWYMAMSLLTWGMFLRLVYVLHVTWFVNSATHMWGYVNYKTTDDSKNLWWVGLLGFGEGWHNNHHAYQRMAKHGHRWWEIDVSYWQIVALEKLGLIWNVVHDVPGRKLHAAVEAE